MTATSNPEAATRGTLDVARIRGEFPALHQDVKGKPLVYLDNAASSHKPQQVIDALSSFYANDYSNIHRGVHELSERATRAYEGSRLKVQRFLGAASEREIVFVRGTTEGINLVAQTYGRANVGEGDEILITTMEHHSNIVPWQMLCEEKGAVLKVVPINDRGELEMDELERLIGPRTRIVSVVHVSNALGTINPVQRIAEIAHAKGAVVLVDGAQAAPHLTVDVKALDCDFYTISGHKMFGPSGIGALYARESLLEEMPPYQGGGDMISSVTFEKTTYNRIPYKFEAGTPNIAGTVGLGATIDYLENLGMEGIGAYEEELLDYGTEKLRSVPGLRLIGEADHKASVLSFVLEGIHPHDIGTILDQEGIAIRTGHHCAQPVMDRYRIPATARASLAVYNNREDIDRLAAGLANGPGDLSLMAAPEELRELYQEVILDHSKNPRNFKELESATHDAKGHNPLCGDRLDLYLVVEDGRIQDVSFLGAGCAISTASASMMSEALKGKSPEEADKLFGEFHAVVTGEEASDEDALGKLAVFAGVRDYPVRVKCATLAWHTLQAALHDDGDAVSTE